MKQGPMIVLETTATKISNRRFNGYCVAFAPPYIKNGYAVAWRVRKAGE